MKRAGMMLQGLSGWTFLATVAAGPWMLGSLPPGAIDALLILIGAAAGLWVLGLLLQRRWPAFNGVVGVGLLLVILGWAVTLHPVARYESDARRFVGNDTSGAGTLDAFTSCLTMRSVSVLFAAFWMGSDLFRNARLRGRFYWTLCLTAASVAVLGILQRAGLSDFLLDQMLPHEGQPFGPFNYHGNAGTLLLMGLAAGGGLLGAALANGRRWAAGISGVLVLVTLVGICVNTSRAAVVLALVMAPLLAFGLWRMFLPAFERPMLHARRIGWSVGMGVAMAAGVALICMPAKWRLLGEQLTGEHGRYIVWRMGAGMARDAGWLGFGPGTFGLMLPLTPRFDPALFRQAIVTYQVPGERVSMWVHAHNDLLQAFVEWGWIGGTLWAVAGVMVLRAGYRAVKRPGVPALDRAGLLGVFAGLLAVMLQSMVDFPFGVLALQLPAVLCAAALLAGEKRGGARGDYAIERMGMEVRIRGGAAVRVSPLVRRVRQSADKSAPGRVDRWSARDR